MVVVALRASDIGLSKILSATIDSIGLGIDSPTFSSILRIPSLIRIH
jgi:hypothetical protein